MGCAEVLCEERERLACDVLFSPRLNLFDNKHREAAQVPERLDDVRNLVRVAFGPPIQIERQPFKIRTETNHTREINKVMLPMKSPDMLQTSSRSLLSNPPAEVGYEGRVDNLERDFL